MGAISLARLARPGRIVAAALLLGSSLGVLPFASSAGAASGPAGNLDQCANGGVGNPPEQCAGGAWVNGNLNANQAHYLEGDSLPYRIRFSDIPTSGSHTATIEWDTTKGGKHALDYLTTYNRTEGNAVPATGSFSTFPIPADLTMSGEADWQPGATQAPGVFTMFGGTITGVSAYSHSGSYAGDSSTGITLTFTASVSTPVLSWAGHIASRADWGQDNSAIAISGSPYHTRLLEVDGSGGNQDRSLSADAVIFPGSITVVKSAAPEGSTSFVFAATGGQLPATFSLVDDGDESAVKAVTAITTFGTSTVTEAVTAGWTLSGLSCDDSGSSVNQETRTATIDLDEGEDITCTFQNTGNATINVVKTAAPETLPEPGGNVTFSVAVTNESTVSAVTITSLSDSIYGNIAAAGGQVISTTCAVPLALAASETKTCSFTGHVSGDAGDSETDVVTASGTDALGNPVSDTDDAVVTLTDVSPGIVVDKSAAPSTVAEPGAPVTFTVTVTNPAGAVEAIHLDSLVDDIYGDLDGQGTCQADGQAIQPGASYSCAFTETVSGAAGSTHTNVVTGTASDNEGNDVSDDDDATVRITDVAPAIVVDKAAAPSSMPEPGGPVTFTVTVTNPAGAIEAIYLDDLNDDIYGDLDGQGTCQADGQAIQPGASYSCTFTKNVTGDEGFVHTDVVTGTASDDDGNDVSDDDDATVRLTDVLPAISVDKTASPTSVPEPGGLVTFTVTVTNTGTAEEVFLDDLTDDIYGDLDDRGTCDADGQAIQPGASYTCSFTGPVAGNAGSTHTDVVTATASDDDENSDSDSDDATVTITDVRPAIGVVKTASPTSLPEPGGPVTFTVTVTNPAAAVEDIYLDDLDDDIYGDLDGQGTCQADGQAIAPGGSYTCSFTQVVNGDAGSTHTDVVTATGSDDENNNVSSTDDATVNLTDVKPTIVVDKSAAPSTLPEPGGPVTFTVVVTNTGTAEPVFLDGLTDDIYGDLDDKGTCDADGQAIEPGGSYTCSFTETVTGNAGSEHVDVVTGTASDDDENSVSDSDDAKVTITDVLPTIVVDKSAAPSTLSEPGGAVTFTVVVTNTGTAEPVFLDDLNDNVYGDLDGQGTCEADGQAIEPGAGYTCSFTQVVSGDAGSQHIDVVTGTASDDDQNSVSDDDDATVDITDVAPAVVVDKAAAPSTQPEPGGPVTFTVTVSNPVDAVEAIFLGSLLDDVYGDLNGKGTCQVDGQSIAPGASYTCSFTETVSGDAGFVHTNVVTGTAHDNDDNDVSDTGTATVTITDVKPSVVVDKAASPTSLPEPGGNVTFQVTVSNPAGAVEAVFLSSLVDDVYGDLDGKGTCQAAGQSIDPGASYTCAFTGTVSGNAGFVHTNVVTGTVGDNEENEASDTGTATVTVTDVKPVISVDKTAGASSVDQGGAVTYTYKVTNPGIEPLVKVTVVDDKCSPVGFTGGDTDGDSRLDPGETWAYSCTANLTVTTTNTAVASGEDDEGNKVSATDKATVEVIPPVVVLGVVLEPPPAVLPAVTLPVTGAQALAAARVALVLVTIGGLLVLMARRRQEPRRS